MGKTNSTIALLVSSVSPVDAVRATHPMVSTPSKIAKLLVFWDGASRVAWIAVPPRSQRQRLTAARDSHPPVLNHASRASLLEHFDKILRPFASFWVGILHGEICMPGAGSYSSCSPSI